MQITKYAEVIISGLALSPEKPCRASITIPEQTMNHLLHEQNPNLLAQMKELVMEK